MRRRRRRHHRRACGDTRPGRAASATSSAGSSTTASRRATRAEADARAASACTSYLTELAAAQPVGEHGLRRAGLAQRQPVGAGRPRTVRPDRRARPWPPGRRTSTGRCSRRPRSAPARSSRRSTHAGVPVQRVRRRRRPDEERAADADLRRRARTAADALSAPSRARRSARRSTPPSPPAPTPTCAAAAAVMGRAETRRVPADPGQRRRLRRALRRVPRPCTTTSGAAATTSCTGCAISARRAHGSECAPA